MGGTELVYAGRAAGTHFHKLGGASNYLCMPEVPEYQGSVAGNQGYSNLHGVEYEAPLGGVLSPKHDHNAPCAVCHVSTRAAALMLPGRVSCPMSWTLEYSGYLVSGADRYNNHKRTTFECLDMNPESIPGSFANIEPAFFYTVEAVCGTGLPCPPYDREKEVNCAVCTK